MLGVKRLAAAAAILGGAVALSGAASASPVPATGGLSAAPASQLVETVQYWGPGYGPRPFYGPRPGWRRGGAYGPPVVCRFRPSPWGPRRVCFRRY
jgi:hypothetical protein